MFRRNSCSTLTDIAVWIKLDAWTTIVSWTVRDSEPLTEVTPSTFHSTSAPKPSPLAGLSAGSS
jgi:hypothetical protein